MTDGERNILEKHAHNIRRDIIEMTTHARSGHVGGSLSSADIITILYFKIMKYKKDNPTWPERDRFILSAGHYCPALYAAFAEADIIPKSELNSLRQIDSRLQGHPSSIDLPQVETASGSLGQGLSLSLGRAMALKKQNNNATVYCLMSDGEQEEGSTWEAVMAASHYKQDNLIAIIDRNNMQIDGTTENVIGVAPLSKKYESFGWEVLESDGHDFDDLERVLVTAKDIHEKPSVIIAHTTMGKGIRSIENNYKWHGQVFSANEAKKAILELDDSYKQKRSK